MTKNEAIESVVVEKFRLLPLGKKKEVLDFVEFLQSRSEEPSEDKWRNLYR